MRVLIALFLLTAGAFGAVSKLYLKDGTYQLVREWKRDGDRVKFYSTERSDWEEVPANLVDLRKSEAELNEQKEIIASDAKIRSDEDNALRAEKREILKIPQDSGVYTLNDAGNLRIFKLAESKVHTNKGRSILKIAVQLPMVPGKATVEIDGEHSASIVTDPRQEFYLQLEKDERFGIIKLQPHKGVRIAERLSIIDVAQMNDEQVDEVPSFKKQLSEGGLYKIWPEKAFEPGEYAIIEFTPGKIEPRIWDFEFRKAS